MDDWLGSAARRAPDAVALFAGGESISYAELDRRATATARRLAALGVRAGDRVATTLPAGPDFVSLLHAVPRAGAALAPLNTRLTAAEQRAQLERLGVRLMVDEPLTGDQADAQAETDPAKPLTVLQTSGTSGAPKLVELSHANHLASALASAWNLGVAPDDRWLCPLPLFHIGGLAVPIRSAIYGTAAIVHDGFDVERAGASIESGEATLASLVPTMLARMLGAGLDRAPALRAILLGGGPVTQGLLERAAERGLPVLATYGMTETCSQVVTASLEDPPAERAAAGRALPGVRLEIGDDGEILVRGPMVARGALSGDGWLHTGDRGRLDADGSLHVEGRLDDVIVTGGENVMATEVEQALLAHPSVSDAAVVGTPDPEWGEAVTAFVVLGDEPNDRALIEHVRHRLGAFKAPRRIVRVTELPRNAAGKVERAELRVRAKQPNASG